MIAEGDGNPAHHVQSHRCSPMQIIKGAQGRNTFEPVSATGYPYFRAG